MSKSDKLARLKSSVKESTGLTYNTSGNVIELNFTPNVTQPGVSVPLVVAGDQGPCATVNVQVSAIPYAIIEDHKPSSTDGGAAYDNTESSQPGFQMGSNYFRTRDLNTRVFDAIGVSINPTVVTPINGGGPGNSFSLPPGTYRICATTTIFRVGSTQTILCELGNTTSPILIGNSGYNQSIGSGQQYDVTFPGVKGIFIVSSETERYAIAQTFQTNNISPARGMGLNVGAITTFDNVYTQVELWKLN